jgi:hypothetical protein
VPDEFQYAVFYEDDHCTDLIEMFDDFERAAQFAAGVESYTEGSVYGVQRSDGALEPANTWPRFLELRKAHHEVFMESIRNPKPREMRKIPNPFFKQRNVWVEVGEVPDWVGGSDA